MWICVLNVPGTFHNSKMADYRVYDAMERIYKEYGVKVVMDLKVNISKKYFIVATGSIGWTRSIIEQGAYFV